jgi:hypothetical protein
LLESLNAEYSRRKFFTNFSQARYDPSAGNGAGLKGLEMFDIRCPQLFPRQPLAATAMRCRILAAHSVVASGIGEVLSGFVVLTNDPSGGPGM